MSTLSASPPVKVLSEKSLNTLLHASKEASEDPNLNADKQNPKTNEVKAIQEQTYVSPSDNILSPTSKKLSELKGKRFANAKSRSLFAKTVSKEGLKSQEKLSRIEKAV